MKPFVEQCFSIMAYIILRTTYLSVARDIQTCGQGLEQCELHLDLSGEIDLLLKPLNLLLKKESPELRTFRRLFIEELSEGIYLDHTARAYRGHNQINKRQAAEIFLNALYEITKDEDIRNFFRECMVKAVKPCSYTPAEKTEPIVTSQEP